MAKILSIETSTALCSVALAIDGKVLSFRRSDEVENPDGSTGRERAHASLTAVFCDEVLREAGLKPAELDAVCISDGPGSYTGLRVGLSTAKGLCFGTGAKLLSISSLDVLAAMALKQLPKGCRRIIPMIDARRMEVFCAEYNTAGERISDIEAVVVEPDTFAAKADGCLFIGDGALKCCESICGAVGKAIASVTDGVTDGPSFIGCCPDAAAMAGPAEAQYAASAWRDVAYFEPFYLKDYIPTKSTKKLF